MNEYHEKLIRRIEKLGDDDLAQDVSEELFKLRRGLALKPYLELVERAENSLGEACDLAAEDITGQDGEEYANACARDLIDARDALLREEDPDRYSEMKAMGQLR